MKKKLSRKEKAVTRTLDILGTTYTVYLRDYKDDPYFEAGGYEGYCDGLTKRIVICKPSTHPAHEYESEHNETQFLEQIYRETLRHEIVHAFFNESGLADSANAFPGAWCRNEELVDWLAMQGEKLCKCWQTAGVL